MGKLVELLMGWDKRNDHGRMSGRPWQRIREVVMLRDGCICQLCRKITRPSDIEIDHIHPLADGGSNDLDNLRVTCRACNQGRRKRTRGCDVDGFPIGGW